MLRGVQVAPVIENPVKVPMVVGDNLVMLVDYFKLSKMIGL